MATTTQQIQQTPGQRAPGTQELIDVQAGDIANRIRGRQNLGNFLDFNIGSLFGGDPSLSNSRFDFSTRGGGFGGFGGGLKGFPVGGGVGPASLIPDPNNPGEFIPSPVNLSKSGEFAQLEQFGGVNLNPDLRETGQRQLLQQFQSGRLPQGQQELIKGIFDPIRQRGQEDIFQFADELAGRGGLNLSDSPVAGAATRSLSDLFSNLGGQEAGATLGQFNTNLGNLFNLTNQQNQLQQQGFQNRLSQQQFQQQVQQNAIQNRLALLGGGTPGADITGPLLGREGFNRSITTQAPDPEDPNFLEIFGKLAPGIGDFFRGGPGGGPSSARGILDLIKSFFPSN